MRLKPQRTKRTFWRRCRIYFRRFRITVWLLLLCILGLLLYLNQVGLPAFIKQPLVQKLRDKGLDLQFSRLRLRWYQGIVADDVRFDPSNQPDAPLLTVREMQVGLSLQALLRFQLQPDRLMLRHGRLVWNLGDSKGRRELAVENIQTHLRFLPNDLWALDHFTADFANAKLQVSGTVTNASAVAGWGVFHGTGATNAPPGSWQKRLRRLADTLDEIHFSENPELRVTVRGDARVFSSFTVRLAIAAPGAQTPWGTVSQGRFNARLFAIDTNGASRAELTLEAADAQTRWASITNFQMDIHLASVEGQTNLIAGDLTLSAMDGNTHWAHGSNLVLSANWIHSITNPVPLSGQGRLRCDAAETEWAAGRRVELLCGLSTPQADKLPACDESWAWWTNIHPYVLDWRCSLEKLDSPRLTGSNLVCAGNWAAPQLTVSNLALEVGGGRLEAKSDLDVASRFLNVQLKSRLDPNDISGVLTPAARHWLEQFTWNGIPQVEGSVSLTLPAWTNRQPDWSAEVQPTLQIRGEFHVPEGGTYRQVRVSAAESHLSYSNLAWHLPDLTLIRPEGRVVAEHRANDREHTFYWRVQSRVDPKAVKPLLGPEAQNGLDLLQLTGPPVVEAEVWGVSHQPELTGIKGRAWLTNFVFRGETATALQVGVQYTNKVLQLLEPKLERGAEKASADGLMADFNSQLIFLTNGASTADPMVIARAIGPKVAKAIEPYFFAQPPKARVSGTIPMHGEEGADLQFDLEGGPFHWWKFSVPWITGRVHWAGLALELRDVHCEFYGGRAEGWADFRFPPGPGAEFTSSLTVTNALFQELMADLSTRTNRLEGRLSGSLGITRGRTENWNLLSGFGDLSLRDGLIWDIPLFGIFTPILDGISPGLGHTRASSAACSYTITNGVVHTDDLEIRSPAIRLQYRGTVDLDSRVNARVEAELLRDVWLIGPIVSTVLWPVTKMFEYRVTGSLTEPKTQPVYIVPKLVLMPFHPLRTLKNLLPEETPRTNPPPVFRNF